MSVEPRYAQVSEPAGDRMYAELQALCGVVFGPGDPLDGRWRLENMPLLSCFEARVDGVLVGFKLGYAHTSLRYYSWLGGVHPDHRQGGIANRLMVMQHAWAQQQGFNIIETEVSEGNVAMLALNLKCGFVQVGEKQALDGRHLILRKQLQSG